jgi:hypothetical protein
MVDHHIAFMRRSTACLLVATSLLWLALLDLRGGQSIAVGTIRALSTVIPFRPSIYTFTEHAPKEDDDNFRIWKASWEAAGFDAKYITLKDAAQYADFESYSKAIGEILPYGNRNTKMKYFRYLAMNVLGGGLLSDIDVYPLWPFEHMKLSSKGLRGQFTVRCGSVKQASGCLMSGSADEWNRIALELLNSVQRQYALLHNQESKLGLDSRLPIWSDEVALQEIVSFANPTGRPIATQESQVLSLVQARDMQSVEGHIQLLTCHENLDRIAVKIDESVDFGRTWMPQWNKDCVNTVARADLLLPKR